MSDIRRRTGAKGTTYQVRYASKAAKTGYAYATFETRKEARRSVRVPTQSMVNTRARK
jgi:integrase